MLDRPENLRTCGATTLIESTAVVMCFCILQVDVVCGDHLLDQYQALKDVQKSVGDEALQVSPTDFTKWKRRGPGILSDPFCPCSFPRRSRTGCWCCTSAWSCPPSREHERRMWLIPQEIYWPSGPSGLGIVTTTVLDCPWTFFLSDEPTSTSFKLSSNAD